MKKKCSKVAQSKDYLEMQSRVRNLNCFRSAMQVQSATNIAPTPGAPNEPGGDSATFAQNSIEDFALAPIFGLDRREIATTAFVHGTEEHRFHQALVALHSLQRLRKRQLLLDATAQQPSSSGSVPGSPRSSLFTWDLVDAAPEIVLDDDEDGTEALPDIAEEPAEGEEGARFESLETLESLTSQFQEACDHLRDIGTAKAKERAKRLAARFYLVAHDVAAGERKEQLLDQLSELCKVKFNHKKPNVPGASLSAAHENEEVVLPTGLQSSEYSSDTVLKYHIEKCLKDGRDIRGNTKSLRNRPGQGTEWSYSDARCAQFWKSLSQLGRARLFTLLAAKLPEPSSESAPTTAPAGRGPAGPFTPSAPAAEAPRGRANRGAPARRPMQVATRNRAAPQRGRRAARSESSSEESEASNSISGSEEEDLLQVSNANNNNSSLNNVSTFDFPSPPPNDEPPFNFGLRDDGSDDDDGGDETPVRGGQRRPSGNQAGETSEFEIGELLPVLARGLEFVKCPENRRDVMKVLISYLQSAGKDEGSDGLRKAVGSSAMTEWFPRLTGSEADQLRAAIPSAARLPEFVALQLRMLPPPSAAASPADLERWVDDVSIVVSRAQEADDKEKNLMSCVCIHALHYALLAREQLAWWKRYGTRQATTLADLNASSPVQHSIETPLVVPKQKLLEYLSIYRAPGSVPFAPGTPDPRKSLPTRLHSTAAELVWNHGSIQEGSRKPAVSAADDETLVHRLCSALVVSGDAGSPSDPLAELKPKLQDQWLKRVVAEAQLLYGLGSSNSTTAATAAPSAAAAAAPASSPNATIAMAGATSAGAADAAAAASLAYTKAGGDLVTLTERTEVEFEKCNKTYFDTDGPVEVLVRSKNCGALAVRIFDVDARRYYLAHGKEVPSDLSLEGLEPNAEVVLSELQSLPPLRRNLLRLRLPFVEAGGTFLLELVGNGVSCRALLHVGSLHLAELSRSPVGQGYAIYDRAWRRVEGAKLLVDGMEIEPKDGVLTVPYHAKDGSGKWTKAVVVSGRLCSLFDIMRFDSKSIQLSGGFFIDEEQLIAGNTCAQLLCSAQLMLNEERLPMKNLKGAVLQVFWKNREDGSFELGGRHDVILKDDQDLVFQLEIPRDARALKLELTATMQRGKKSGADGADRNKEGNNNNNDSSSNDEPHELRLPTQEFAIHGVSAMRAIFDVHLAPGLELQALGRSGEPIRGQQIDVSLVTATSKDALGPFKLRTDDAGRIKLGTLEEVISVQARFSAHPSSGTTSREWKLLNSHSTFNCDVGSSGAPIVYGMPIDGTLKMPLPPSTTYSLIQASMDVGRPEQDLTSLVKVNRNFIEISGLPSNKVCGLMLELPDGSSIYRLLLASGQLTSDGKFAIVDNNLFEWRAQDLPPKIESAALSPGKVQLKVSNVQPGAKVHVVARRFWHPMALTTVASKVPRRLPSRRFPARSPESCFLRTRRMGDVVRYVLERRPLIQCDDFTAPSLPAPSTAPFPGICIHGESRGNTKWDVHGDAAGEQVEARQVQSKQRPPPQMTYMASSPPNFVSANVSFSETSVLVANVPLGEDGTAEVSLPDSSSYGFWEVVVAQPNGHAATVLTQQSLAEPKNRDMRLMNEALNPTRHYGEVHGSRVLSENEVFELSTPSVSQMMVYETLPQVFDGLYALLNRSPAFKRFEYLKKWPELDQETKMKHYSKDACNEINLFLFSHDTDFFQGVVVPLLANKRRYSRLDRWFLQLPQQAESSLALTRTCRFEQLLVSAASSGSNNNKNNNDSSNSSAAAAATASAQLLSLLRLCEEDAADEAKTTSLERRSKAYDVMLRPYAAQLNPGHGAGGPALVSLHMSNSAWGCSSNVLRSVPMPGRGLARNRAAAPARRNAPQHRMMNRVPSDCGSMDLYMNHNEAQLSCSSGGEEEAYGRRHSFEQLQDAANPLYCNFTVVNEDEAWYCRPAQRVTEKGWLAGGNGPSKGAAALWEQVALALSKNPSSRWPTNFVCSAALEAGVHGSASEALCALALLNLPFAQPEASDITLDEARQVKVLRARHSSIVFYSMVKEVEAPQESSPLLLTQELKSLGGNVLPRTSELLVNTVIQSDVLAVNCGSEMRELRLLIQCPEGAIPVGKDSFYTRSVDVVVPAFGSTTVSNHFYFPERGSFRWFPAHALADERLVAFEAAAGPLTVVSERGAVDVASWRDVAARGTLEDVLSFLRRPRCRLYEDDLLALAWRMRERNSFDAIISELRLQMRYCGQLWGYGFKYQDVPVIKEFLEMNESFQKLVGPRMESQLLTTDALDGSICSHSDFEGLVLSRAHTMGARRQNIEDADVRRAYINFLQELAYAPSFSLEDRLILTNFMLMQDRIDEARVSFEPVKDVLLPRLQAAGTGGVQVQGPLQIQAAYHLAYLDLVEGGELAQAKIALKAFHNSPWLTAIWRRRFDALARVLKLCGKGEEESSSSNNNNNNEGEGEGGGAAAAAARAKQLKSEGSKAAWASEDGVDTAPTEELDKEPLLQIKEVDPRNHRVRLELANLKPGSMRLACYVVDVELTFSAAPFTGTSSGASHVTAIAPTVAVDVAESEVDAEGWLSLPEAVRRRQMVLEIMAVAKKGEKRLASVSPCYYCEAKVHFDSEDGTLTVVEQNAPASGVYVKIFAGTPAAPRFYKDGYTDCLGCFNYASTNAAKAPFRRGGKLAVLVLSRKSGALVREVEVPPMQKSSGEAHLGLDPFLPANDDILNSGSDSSYNEGSESELSFECEEEE